MYEPQNYEVKQTMGIRADGVACTVVRILNGNAHNTRTQNDTSRTESELSRI